MVMTRATLVYVSIAAIADARLPGVGAPSQTPSAFRKRALLITASFREHVLRAAHPPRAKNAGLRALA